jgi:hypothetical protein
MDAPLLINKKVIQDRQKQFIRWWFGGATFKMVQSPGDRLLSTFVDDGTSRKQAELSAPSTPCVSACSAFSTSPRPVERRVEVVRVRKIPGQACEAADRMARPIEAPICSLASFYLQNKTGWKIY